MAEFDFIFNPDKKETEAEAEAEHENSAKKTTEVKTESSDEALKDTTKPVVLMTFSKKADKTWGDDDFVQLLQRALSLR